MLRDCLYCHYVTRSLFKRGKQVVRGVVILNLMEGVRRGLVPLKESKNILLSGALTQNL